MAKRFVVQLAFPCCVYGHVRPFPSPILWSAGLVALVPCGRGVRFENTMGGLVGGGIGGDRAGVGGFPMAWFHLAFAGGWAGTSAGDPCLGRSRPPIGPFLRLGRLVFVPAGLAQLGNRLGMGPGLCIGWGSGSGDDLGNSWGNGPGMGCRHVDSFLFPALGASQFLGAVGSREVSPPFDEWASVGGSVSKSVQFERDARDVVCGAGVAHGAGVACPIGLGLLVGGFSKCFRGYFSRRSERGCAREESGGRVWRFSSGGVRVFP